MSTENQRPKRIALRRLIVVLMAALFAIPTVIGTANAAPGSTGDRQDFTAPATGAGLTSTEAAALQKRVDAYLTKSGGTQVAANEIRLSDGGSLLLALPGEKYARQLSDPVGTQASCPYYYLCYYSGTYYTGDVRSAYSCSINYYVPYVGYGSWINNQTPGTRAQFKNQYYQTIYTTPGAYSASPSYYWTPVYWTY